MSEKRAKEVTKSRINQITNATRNKITRISCQCFIPGTLGSICLNEESRVPPRVCSALFSRQFGTPWPPPIEQRWPHNAIVRMLVRRAKGVKNKLQI